MYARIDLISHTTGKLNAPAMAWLEIIDWRGDVALCHYNGQRFSTHRDNLVRHPSECTPSQKVEQKPKTKRRK